MAKDSQVWDCKNRKPCSSDEKEWEEVVCPICMEHPHNAVLLICSSHEKGCRPFVCNTSNLLSNCFELLQKSSKIELVSCPLCRGKISGFDAQHPAREIMNCMTRSCPSETCSMSGNYADLERHASLQHPSEVGPARLQNWTAWEQQRYTADALLSMSAANFEVDAWPVFWSYDVIYFEAQPPVRATRINANVAGRQNHNRNTRWTPRHRTENGGTFSSNHGAYDPASSTTGSRSRTRPNPGREYEHQHLSGSRSMPRSRWSPTCYYRESGTIRFLRSRRDSDSGRR